MKKGLSVLLIAAALFGFYGGATSLNDVLASKDYWEEVGEKSTADMNKLEDGLNQLKDNEKAYLDGQKTLAEGEKTLADGEAQYAQGLADYAAAPGKLAAGEAELSQGYSDFNSLKALISGLNTVRKHGSATTKNHDVYWHDGFTFNTFKQNGKAGLKPARSIIVQTLKGQAASVALIESLTGYSDLVSSAEKAGSYEAFDNVVNKKLTPAFNGAVKALNGFIGLANGKANELENAASAHERFLGLESNRLTTAEKELQYVQAQPEESPLKALQPTLEGMQGSPYFTVAPASKILRGAVAAQLTDFLSNYGETLQKVAAGNPDFANLVSAMQTLADNGTDASSFGPTVNAVVGGLREKAIPMLEEYADMANKSVESFKAWDAGYHTLADAKDGKGANDLASKSEGIPFAFSQMLSNKTIKTALYTYDSSLIPILRVYSGSKLANEDLDAFDKDLTYIANSVIPRAQAVLSNVRSSAVRQLADGEAQLAQGYADYAAAPAKLADAEKQLADGRKQLEDGKKKLAEYEDGEQQVRDGLATLMATEADPGLESILDRRNGDDKFDDANGHLQLDEGLEAVDTGRGYQAESGELITKEVTNRAVGTAAGLGAAALAVLAAILSFLKKNKGAAVSAVLAAVAGGIGAGVGLSAGEYYSDIAGSTIGNTPFIAAAILAVVAAVFAIVHFTAKPEAK